MSDKFLEAVKERHSYYALGNDSTIPDSKIEEIVKFAVTHAPSTYNVQSARAVLLLGKQNERAWDIVKGHMEAAMEGNPMKDYILSRMAAHRASHGTVLWYEDQTALDGLGEKNPMVKPMLTECMEYPYLRLRNSC